MNTMLNARNFGTQPADFLAGKRVTDNRHYREIETRFKMQFHRIYAIFGLHKESELIWRSPKVWYAFYNPCQHLCVGKGDG